MAWILLQPGTRDSGLSKLSPAPSLGLWEPTRFLTLMRPIFVARNRFSANRKLEPEMGVSPDTRVGKLDPRGTT